MAKRSSSKRKAAARKFAPIGLALSVIAFLAGVLLLAVKLLVLMQIYSPPNQQWINTALLIDLAFFILGFALFALLDPKRVREFLTGRQAKHGSNALITLIALFGIILVVNLLVYQNQTPWDWTESKQHTLAPETLETLKSLPSPVTALAFFTQNYSSSSAEDLLINLRDNSKGLFDYQIIDPERNPALAQKYNITRDGTIVLILDNRQEILRYTTEQEITSALIRLMNPGERVIYFLTGHGESDILTSGDTSLTQVVATLETKNYTIRSWNLRAENSIPDDALAIIIAGPTIPLSIGEVAHLEIYLDGGGSLVVLEQCPLEIEPGTGTDPLLNYLAESWGVAFNNDLVIDPSSDPISFAISYAYGSHAITKNLTSTITFFPVARSLSLTPSADITQYPLVMTIARAWGETDFDALLAGSFNYDEGADNSGPILLAAALEKSTGGKLVAFGDSSFATDGFVNQYGNSDLIINAVDWAAGEQDLISLTPKETVTRSLNPIQNPGWIILGLSFICIIPGIIIAGGIISWVARRARG